MDKNIFTYVFLICILILSCSDSGTNPSNEFSGITRTGEGSPDPIGEIDPDDWLLPGDIPSVGLPIEYYVMPAYPNPCNHSTTIQFSVAQRDSVNIWVDDKPEGEIILIMNSVLNPGVYSVNVDLSEPSNRKEGILRFYFDFPLNPDFEEVHGDILFKR